MSKVDAKQPQAGQAALTGTAEGLTVQLCFIIFYRQSLESVASKQARKTIIVVSADLRREVTSFVTVCRSGKASTHSNKAAADFEMYQECNEKIVTVTIVAGG